MTYHTLISLIKSILRIIASVLLIGVGIGLPYFPLGVFETLLNVGILFLLAEILGVLEEL